LLFTGQTPSQSSFYTSSGFPSLYSLYYHTIHSEIIVLKPIKALGQNFLRDENILNKIVESLDLQNGDVVIEIGPGQGALTNHLNNMPVKLIGIEVDERAIRLLQDRFGEKLDLIHRDVLEVKLAELALQNGGTVRIVGNIPYYLTSEILFWLFDARTVIIDATLMVQVEVAKRLIAPPKNKEYGILSIFTQFYTDCELLFKVSRNCFYPKPEVDSAVVRLRFKEQLPQCDEKLFRSVVRSTFGQRRKTLRNGLKSMGYDDRALKELPCDLTKRPEELGVEEFLLLTTMLGKNSNHN
jgi:16S rRNA (adenine1518-N6/adenine1519-N6)-dimethyltransferase